MYLETVVDSLGLKLTLVFKLGSYAWMEDESVVNQGLGFLRFLHVSLL